MKKLILAATAISMIATPALAAPQRHDNGRNAKTVVVNKQPRKTVVVQRNVYRPAPVVQQRKWVRGQRFDYRYARNYRQIDYRNYRQRGLYAPPRGYQWVQSGNDAVLIAITGGLIGAIIGGAIN